MPAKITRREAGDSPEFITLPPKTTYLCGYQQAEESNGTLIIHCRPEDDSTNIYISKDAAPPHGADEETLKKFLLETRGVLLRTIEAGAAGCAIDTTSTQGTRLEILVQHRDQVNPDLQ
jgi:hypothetical protein